MEYQAGLHDTLIKKMLPVCIAAVKRMGATEKLAQQRFAVKPWQWNLKIVQKED